MPFCLPLTACPMSFLAAISFSSFQCGEYLFHTIPVLGEDYGFGMALLFYLLLNEFLEF